MASSKSQIILVGLLIVHASLPGSKQFVLSGKDFTKDFTTKDTMFKTPYVDIDEWRKNLCAIIMCMEVSKARIPFLILLSAQRKI
jgi:hypothetical protein